MGILSRQERMTSSTLTTLSCVLLQRWQRHDATLTFQSTAREMLNNTGRPPPKTAYSRKANLIIVFMRSYDYFKLLRPTRRLSNSVYLSKAGLTFKSLGLSSVDPSNRPISCGGFLGFHMISIRDYFFNDSVQK